MSAPNPYVGDPHGAPVETVINDPEEFRVRKENLEGCFAECPLQLCPSSWFARVGDNFGKLVYCGNLPLLDCYWPLDQRSSE